MTAKLTFELDMKDIRKFAILSDIELSDEQEQQIISSSVVITRTRLQELFSDNPEAILAFAGIVLSVALGEQ